MVPEAIKIKQTEYSVYLLTRINQLERDNKTLEDELVYKRKREEDLTLENMSLKLVLSAKVQQSNQSTPSPAKKRKIDVELPPKGYKYLPEKEMNNKLLEQYKLLENIQDIIELKSCQYKHDFLRNKKFQNLYNLIPVLEELNNMIGMTNIKQEIFEHICYFIQNLNNKKELMHLVITGPPGVGKTEVGKIIGKIYLSLGFLNSDKFIIARRSDLIGGYLGQTAIKTQKIIDSAQDGVLFIDEVYSLGNEEKRDSYSKECIDTINQNLTENKGRFLCIIAGYKEHIDSCFFSYNDGLQRRFPLRYDIKQYTSNELVDIFMKKLHDDSTQQDKWILDIGLEDMQKLFEKEYERFKYYGGDIELILQKCKFLVGVRTMKTSIDNIPTKTITLNDIEKAIQVVLKDRIKEIKEEVLPFGMYT